MQSIKLVLVLLVLGLASCMPTQIIPQTGSSDHNQTLPANSSWLLESFGEPGAELPAIAGTSISLEFKQNGQVEGSSGCNSYGGPYSVQDGRLAFGEIVSTLMACEDQAVNDQEQEYLQALRASGRFSVVDDRLTIWYENDRRVLNFARAPESTPVSSSTTTPEPTAGAVPGKDDGARIEFPPGQSSAEVFAELTAGMTDSYLVRGEQGQTMSAEITSPNNDVLLSVIAEDGTPLKRYQNGLPSWTGTLPATQDYVLQAVSVGETAAYTLRVQIEAIPPQARERVEFEPGYPSATRSGILSPGGVKEYVLSAAAGQRMHIQTVGYSAPVHFTLRSPDGQSWSGEPGASDVYIFTMEVFLPEAGDYVVTLSVLLEEEATRYDAAFTIDAGTQSSAPPERVEFESGAVSAQRSGLLPSGPGLKEYVLAGRAGETMTITITSDGAPLSLMITTPSGVQRIPETSPAEGAHAISHTFTLAESGDYLITLSKADHTPSTNFTVDFTVE
jgi:heat shock protein HslJ